MSVMQQNGVRSKVYTERWQVDKDITTLMMELYTRTYNERNTSAHIAQDWILVGMTKIWSIART